MRHTVPASAHASFTAETLLRQHRRIRKSDPFSDGYSSDQFLLPSGKGEAFDTPQAILSYSGTGLTKLSQQYHEIIREHICRGAYKHAKRPILINNWEATYFDFNEEKILKIAEQAQKLGIEMLVLDDGWFGNERMITVASATGSSTRKR